MKLKHKIAIAEQFNDMDDLKIERSKLHKLADICGADTWEDIEFGEAKYEWLKKF